MEYAEKAEFTDGQYTGEIVFHIIEHIGVLSETKGWRRELNVVSWNKKPAKFDIRDWDEYHEHMRKGITLTKGELKELRNILVDMDFRKTEVPETKSRKSREDGLPPLFGQDGEMTEPLAAAGYVAMDHTAATGTGSGEGIPF